MVSVARCYLHRFGRTRCPLRGGYYHASVVCLRIETQADSIADSSKTARHMPPAVVSFYLTMRIIWFRCPLFLSVHRHGLFSSGHYSFFRASRCHSWPYSENTNSGVKTQVRRLTIPNRGGIAPFNFAALHAKFSPRCHHQ